MTKSDMLSLDIALATEAHGMYARLLTKEEKQRISAMTSADELVSFLRGSRAWGAAARELPTTDTTDAQFSMAMERAVYSEFARLYRFAETTARDFLIFIALRMKSKAILDTLGRLSNPGDRGSDAVPHFFLALPGYGIDQIMSAKSYAALTALGGNGIFGDTLRSLPIDKATGLPRLAEAAEALEARYYAVLDEFLRVGYKGPDKARLTEIMSFRSDLRDVSYLLRLRWFGTSLQKGRELLPLGGSLGRKLEDAILTAKSDDEALRLVLSSRVGKYLGRMDTQEPERFVRAAEDTYFRHIIHGPPCLSVAYAYMVLSEAECAMLRRAFVSLRYGLDPGDYL